MDASGALPGAHGAASELSRIWDGQLSGALARVPSPGSQRPGSQRPGLSSSASLKPEVVMPHSGPEMWG